MKKPYTWIGKGLFISLLVGSPSVFAGIDAYPQARYDCNVSADPDKPGRRVLSVEVRNRSKHLHIYGFRVDAKYLDCKIKDPRPSKEFIERACTARSTARMGLGSMAKPPRSDIHVAPGQTRSYRYYFRFPGNPSHKKHLYEYCETYSTATFSAADAPRVLGLSKEEAEGSPFWKRWWRSLKGWFE